MKRNRKRHFPPVHLKEYWSSKVRNDYLKELDRMEDAAVAFLIAIKNGKRYFYGVSSRKFREEVKVWKKKGGFRGY